MSKSGKFSRDKGLRVEREFVNRHRESGVPAERVPLSGAAGGSYTGDLTVTLPVVGPLNVEVKARADGREWAWVARTLEGHDALYLRQDHCDPLVVLPWHVWEGVIRVLLYDHDRASKAHDGPHPQVRPPVGRPEEAGVDLGTGHRDGDDRGPDCPPVDPGHGV